MEYKYTALIEHPTTKEIVVVVNEKKEPSFKGTYGCFVKDWQSNHKYISFANEDEKNKVIDMYKHQMNYDGFGKLKEKVLDKRFKDGTNEINYVEIKYQMNGIRTVNKGAYLPVSNNVAYFKNTEQVEKDIKKQINE